MSVWVSLASYSDNQSMLAMDPHPTVSTFQILIALAFDSFNSESPRESSAFMYYLMRLTPCAVIPCPHKHKQIRCLNDKPQGQMCVTYILSKNLRNLIVCIFASVFLDSIIHSIDQPIYFLKSSNDGRVSGIFSQTNVGVELWFITKLWVKLLECGPVSVSMEEGSLFEEVLEGHWIFRGRTVVWIVVHNGREESLTSHFFAEPSGYRGYVDASDGILECIPTRLNTFIPILKHIPEVTWASFVDSIDQECIMSR